MASGPLSSVLGQLGGDRVSLCPKRPPDLRLLATQEPPVPSLILPMTTTTMTSEQVRQGPARLQVAPFHWTQALPAPLPRPPSQIVPQGARGLPWRDERKLHALCFSVSIHRPDLLAQPSASAHQQPQGGGAVSEGWRALSQEWTSSLGRLLASQRHEGVEPDYS